MNSSSMSCYGPKEHKRQCHANLSAINIKAHTQKHKNIHTQMERKQYPVPSFAAQNSEYETVKSTVYDHLIDVCSYKLTIELHDVLII